MWYRRPLPLVLSIVAGILIVAGAGNLVVGAIGNQQPVIVGTTPTTAITATFIVGGPGDMPTEKPTVSATTQPTIGASHSNPTPQPTAPKVTVTPCGVGCNPWGYNFSCCQLIYNPPQNFCDFFNCISSFWQHTNGYVDECVDGTYSHSGGVQGACSDHGGEQRPLYAPGQKTPTPGPTPTPLPTPTATAFPSPSPYPTPTV